MAAFQKVVGFAVIILLIISLVIIGIMISKEKGKVDIAIASCPDYWEDASGPNKPEGSACVNTHSLGKCNLPAKGQTNSMDFTTATFTGANGLCAKSTWAKNCGNLVWSGITEKNQCTEATTA